MPAWYGARKIIESNNNKWWTLFPYLLDGVPPALVADFGRDRYEINGFPKTVNDVLTMSSGIKWVVNSAGVLTQVAADTPAFDYSSGLRQFLLEGSSTNTILGNNEITYFTQTNATFTVGSAFGDWSNLVLNAGTASGNHQVETTPSGAFSVSNPYVFSVIAKAGTGRYLQLLFSSVVFSSSDYATFDLQAGIITSNTSSLGAYITSLGNGYYRCECAATAPNTGNAVVAIIVSNAPTGRAPAFTGANETIYLVAPQVEQKTRASSCIRTTGASATRITDICKLTPAAAAVFQGSAATYAFRASDLVASSLQYLLGPTSGIGLLRSGGGDPSQIIITGQASTSINLGNSIIPGEFGICGAFDPSGQEGYSNIGVGGTITYPITVSMNPTWIGGRSLGVNPGVVLNIAELVAWLIRGSSASLVSQARLYS